MPSSASLPRAEHPTTRAASSPPPGSRRSLIGGLRKLAGESRDLGNPSLETADLGARLSRARELLDRGVAMLTELQRQDSRDEEVEIDGFDDMFSETPQPSARPVRQ